MVPPLRTASDFEPDDRAGRDSDDAGHEILSDGTSTMAGWGPGMDVFLGIFLSPRRHAFHDEFPFPEGHFRRDVSDDRGALSRAKLPDRRRYPVASGSASDYRVGLSADPGGCRPAYARPSGPASQ